jgi:hypothetical protein
MEGFKMSINTTMSQASKGFSKDEAKRLLILLNNHKTSFPVVGGWFEESRLDKLPEKGKAEKWVSLIEKAKGIPIPIARHLLSRFGINPDGKDTASINRAFEKAIATLSK